MHSKVSNEFWTPSRRILSTGRVTGLMNSENATVCKVHNINNTVISSGWDRTLSIQSFNQWKQSIVTYIPNQSINQSTINRLSLTFSINELIEAINQSITVSNSSGSPNFPQWVNYDGGNAVGQFIWDEKDYFSKITVEQKKVGYKIGYV